MSPNHSLNVQNYSSEGQASFAVPTFSGQANAISGGTNLTINVPGATSVNDVMVAVIVINGDGGNGTGHNVTATGWSLIDKNVSPGGANATLAVYQRTAMASEPANYTFSWGTGENAIGTIASFSGVDTNNPVDIFATDGFNSSATPIAPSATTTSADVMVLRIYGQDGDGNSITAPSGTTEIFTGRSGSIGADDVSIGVAYETQAVIGNTGTATFSTGLNNDWRTMTLALKTDTGNSGGIPTGNLSCSAGATEITGVVFEDFNYSGLFDSGEFQGVKGMAVSATDSLGNTFSTETNASGSFTLTDLITNRTYRVEFTIPDSLSWANPTFYGGDNGTRVQFIQPGNCANLGIASPADYCEANPRINVPCYVIGDPLVAGAASSEIALVSLDYNGSGKVDDLDASVIGSVWGNAYNRTVKKSFLGSVLKRHAGLGVGASGNGDDPGAVYVYDHTTGNATYLFSVPNAGTVLSNAARGLTGAPTTPTADPSVYGQIGKVGLGDVEISEDDQFLFIMNLNDKNIYKYDLSTYNNTGNPSDIGSAIQVIPTPNPGCINGQTRPFALKYKRGELFVGLICDASSDSPVFDTRLTPGFESLGALTDSRVGTGNLPNGQNKSFDRRNMYGPNSNLAAHIYSLDESNAYAATQIWSETLDNRERAGTEGFFPTIQYYQPWNDDWTKAGRDDRIIGRVNYPSPVFVDIEVDNDGSLIASFLDRSGFQWGTTNLYPNGTGFGLGVDGFAPTQPFLLGKTYRIAKSGGAYITESNGTTINGGGCGLGAILDDPATFLTDVGNAYPSLGRKTVQENIEGFGFGSNDDIAAADGTRGGGEYYCGDGIRVHPNTTIGGLALLPSSTNIAIAAADPTAFNEGGLIWLDNSTGTRDYELVLYSGVGTGQNAKGAGLGDVELLCSPAPLEIGNYVWLDTDGDGIQDAGEQAIENIRVELYDATGNLLAFDSTNLLGQYYFSGTNIDNATWLTTNDTLMANTNYYLVISEYGANGLNVDGTDYLITTANANGNNSDEIDSDGTIAVGIDPDFNGKPYVFITTGSVGEVNHSYDFGFGSCLEVNELITDRTICSGEPLDTLGAITTFPNPDSIAFVYFTSPQTDSSIIYNSGTGIDTIQITANNDTALITEVAVAAFTATTSPVTYYVYAIKHPIPTAITCRPYEEILVVVNPCDWGDLPDPNIAANVANYQTLRDSSGPVHVIIAGLNLGNEVDGEVNGQPTDNAQGDGNDEDGLTIFPSIDLHLGSSFSLPLSYENTTGQTAHLEAWIDWNGDGNFDAPNEMIFDESDIGASAHDRIEITVPNDALTGQFLGLRIRISNTNNMTPYGKITSGEVEDYLIGIDCPAMTCLPIESAIKRK